MAALVGYSGQRVRMPTFDASGTITTGGTSQLILPVGFGRASLLIENISDTAMYLGIGGPTASASLTSGAVSSVSVVNAGLGYSRAPHITFMGGVFDANRTTPNYSLVSSADFPSPSNPAKAHCVMTGAAGSMTIASIVIDNPGSGYLFPPYVYIHNDPLDPFGSFNPSVTAGILLSANGGSYNPNGSVCTTDQISVFCATTGKAFTCKYWL